MILDRIENASLYYPLGGRIETALRALQTDKVAHAGIGRLELQGSDLFALVQEYPTRPRELGKWEAHRRYIDLQYVVQGAEGMGYANIHHLQQGEYDANKDFLSLHGEGDLIIVKSGYFVLLMPEDAHMPCMALGEPAPARKIVLKIAVE